MLPFALNESTKFISPTKTLEYMAAEKPIVSTPITDVVEPYSHCVSIGRTAEAFLEACDKSMSETNEVCQERLNATRAILAETSWTKQPRL